MYDGTTCDDLIGQNQLGTLMVTEKQTILRDAKYLFLQIP